MGEVRIETQRLILRDWREDDRAPLAALINTPGMLRYFGGMMTPQECDQFFERRLADQATLGFCYWAVVHRDSGSLIGTCGGRVAHDYPADSPVYGLHELGWRIGEQWWQQGFATEAASAVLGWLWRNTPAEMAAAWTTVPNLPSQGVMIKLGMTRRPDLDFDHPRIPDGSPLKRHITYSIARNQ